MYESLMYSEFSSSATMSLTFVVFKFYSVCCRSLFEVQFTLKIHVEMKWLQGKLQQSELVHLISTQAS